MDVVSFIVPTDPGHSYFVLLDGKPVPAGVTNRVTKMDYHEIFVSRTNVATLAVTNRLVRFIIISSNRGDPERGLIEWTPYPQIPSANAEFAGATLELLTPANYPSGMQVPVIARVNNPSGHARRVNGTVTSPGLPSFRILRGHGSGFLPTGGPGTAVEYQAQLGSLNAQKEINIDVATVWTPVSGTLPPGTTAWPINSRIHITGNLTIPASSTLSIGAGTVVRLNPVVNITNTGRTVINGSLDSPVVFTSTNSVLPHVRTYAWGGFYLRNTAAEVVANNAIFTGGGGAASISFSPGASHRPEQPVFFVHSGARLFLTNCAVINTAGQVGNGYNSDVTFDHCLLQRAITAGEYVGGTIIVNESALIEFPEDNGFNDAALVNADYDAIYFTTGTHLLYNTLIGFCKDDAIDSGSGGGGTVLVTNCWFESAVHEANAWSNDSGLRHAQTYDSVLMNNGQGFECGWSGPAGSPACYAGNMLSIANSVGARVGDNYPTIGPYNGILVVTNSFLLHNYRDAWGLTWRTDNTGWYYRSNQMDIRGGFLSQANPYHPSNSIWNGDVDGWRLAPFMTTPANAPVGIGFATWTNTLPISTIFDGVPVRLSSFTTNTVQVDYVWQSGAQPPISGTLTFAPGETVKRVFPYGFNVATYPSPRVILTSPGGGDLTGNTNVQFQGTAQAPFVVSPFGTQRHLDHGRLSEGFPVGLSGPSGVPFTIGYSYEWSGGILRTGVVTFPAGETLAWAAPPEGDLSGIDLVQLELHFQPLPAPFRVYYLKTSGAPTPPPTPVISMGAVWRYPNAPGAPGANWRELSFPDGAWLSGPAQLGFSNGEEDDEATLITNYGPAPNNQVTYYFRRIFNVADPNAFTNLSLTLLRDDAGVVHLNGWEVYRSPNLPAFPNPITHTTTSGSPNGENTIDRATLSRTNLLAGENIAAVEIHQQSTGSSDVSFDFELLGNPVPPPPPPQRLYFGEFDGQLAFVWSDASFVLEQADALTGPWTTASTTSPYHIVPNPNIEQRFFRLRR